MFIFIFLIIHKIRIQFNKLSSYKIFMLPNKKTYLKSIFVSIFYFTLLSYQCSKSFSAFYKKQLFFGRLFQTNHLYFLMVFDLHLINLQEADYF